jgi:hypothetical protein
VRGGRGYGRKTASWPSPKPGVEHGFEFSCGQETLFGDPTPRVRVENMVHKCIEFEGSVFVGERSCLFGAENGTFHETFNGGDGIVPWEDYRHGFHSDSKGRLEVGHVF